MSRTCDLNFTLNSKRKQVEPPYLTARMTENDEHNKEKNNRFFLF